MPTSGNIRARNLRDRRASASALVITLAIVTLISILLLGFLTGVKTETASARTHINGEKAVLFAQMGADAAQARLAAAMPNVGTATTRVISTGTALASASTTNITPMWVAQPGRVLMTSAGSTTPLDASVDLSSGVSTSSTDDAVDLNPPTLADSTQYLLTQSNAALFPNGAPAMRVRWRYVRGNGTFIDTLPTTPPTDAASQVVGRFAFWADDMSARTNVNTAWTHATISNSVNSQSHPSRVSLGSLPLLLAQPTESDAINAFRLTQHPFNALPELQAVDATTAGLPGQYALGLTHVSHSLDLNLLGERRIVLTTQKSLAGNAEFLDILAAANTDPGNYYNLSVPKVLTVVRRIAALLMRTDWPIQANASLANPYNVATPTPKYSDDGWAYQMAINLIDYVRSAESTNPVVEPIRLDYFPASGASGNLNSNGNSVSMVGNSRRLLITEIGVWYGAIQSQGCVYEVEVCLPKNSGFPAPAQLNLLNPLGSNNGLYLNISAVNPDKTTVAANTPLFVEGLQIPILAGPPPAAPDGNAYLDTAIPYITEGGYRKITFNYRTAAGIAGWDSRVLSPGSARPTRMLLAAALATTLRTPPLNIGVTVDNAPSSDDPTKMPIYAVNGIMSSPATISTLSVVTDPRLNKDGSNFSQVPNTFGAPNDDSASLLAQANPTAPQDTDSTGAIVTDSVRLPAPKGAAGNTSGVVSSVGELGYVHSGMQCRAGHGSGTPWRTLRLQALPGSVATGVLPDWVITDLFAAPVVAATAQAALLSPTLRSTAGKINLNAQIYPFIDAAANPSMSRLEPLRSLLYGARKTDNSSPTISTDEATTLATNILKHTKASGGANNLKGKDYGSGNAAGVYFAPGQLVEIAGIGDAGEAGEGLFREISELCTGRGGNVFAIYSVGQTIRQDKNGKVIVLGERRCERVVERWENIGVAATGTAPQNETITPLFRAVYSRDLTP